MSANKEQTGKIDLSLLPPAFKDQVAQVMEFGAKKYGRYNYIKGHRMCEDLLAAIERHVRDLQSGQDVAEDSKLSHFAHIAANCLMALHQIQLGTIKDDRFTAEVPETTQLDGFVAWDQSGVPDSLPQDRTGLDPKFYSEQCNNPECVCHSFDYPESRRPIDK
jgi:hypothetical protein